MEAGGVGVEAKFGVTAKLSSLLEGDDEPHWHQGGSVDQHVWDQIV